MPKAWAGRPEALLDKDEQEANKSSDLFVAEAQTKIKALIGQNKMC